MNKPPNPAAFPMQATGFTAPDGSFVHEYSQDGMTLRDYFAGMVVAGSMAGRSSMVGDPYMATVIATEAYLIADAMLEVRNADDNP